MTRTDRAAGIAEDTPNGRGQQRRPGWAEPLQLENVRAAYGTHEVLCGVDLNLRPGEVHGLVGRNGAGKTTLLQVIAGFVHPTGGTITVGTRRARLEDVGYVPVTEHFYSNITGREFLSLFRDPALARSERGNSAEWADAWARALELPLDHLVDSYSTGMRRKLAILGALRLGRPILILDEPESGLDLESNQLLGQILRALAGEGATVLVTSHVLEALEVACDRVHLLERGVIAGSYAPTQYPALRALLAGDAARRLDAVRPFLRETGSG